MTKGKMGKCSSNCLTSRDLLVDLGVNQLWDIAKSLGDFAKLIGCT